MIPAPLPFRDMVTSGQMQGFIANPCQMVTEEEDLSDDDEFPEDLEDDPQCPIILLSKEEKRKLRNHGGILS